MSYPMLVPNFKILGAVVPEKSLTEKKLNTHTHIHIVMEKTKTIYPLYTSYAEGITIYLPKMVNEKDNMKLLFCF